MSRVVGDVAWRRKFNFSLYGLRGLKEVQLWSLYLADLSQLSEAAALKRIIGDVAHGLGGLTKGVQLGGEIGRAHV